MGVKTFDQGWVLFYFLLLSDQFFLRFPDSPVSDSPVGASPFSRMVNSGGLQYGRPGFDSRSGLVP